MTDAVPGFDPVREEAFGGWWAGVADWVTGTSNTDGLAHEAFCAGWEAAAPVIRREERERIRQLAVQTDAICKGGPIWSSQAIPFADLLREGTP